jgi:hypothetical protein
MSPNILECPQMSRNRCCDLPMSSSVFTGCQQACAGCQGLGNCVPSRPQIQRVAHGVLKCPQIAGQHSMSPNVPKSVVHYF